MGSELYHHGIPGQKWGVRRFQEEDGTLTPEGKRRYAYEMSRDQKKDYNKLTVYEQEYVKKKMEKGKDFDSAKKDLKRSQIRNTIIAGAIVGHMFGLDKMILRAVAKSPAVTRGSLYLKRALKRAMVKKAGAISVRKFSIA